MHDDLSLHSSFLSVSEVVQAIYFTGDFMEFITCCEQWQNGFECDICSMHVNSMVCWPLCVWPLQTDFVAANLTEEIQCGLVHLKIWILPLQHIHVYSISLLLGSVIHKINTKSNCAHMVNGRYLYCWQRLSCQLLHRNWSFTHTAIWGSLSCPGPRTGYKHDVQFELLYCKLLNLLGN